MSKPITADEFKPIFQMLMKLLAQSLIQGVALEMAVFAYTHDPLFGEHMRIARKKAEENWKPSLDRLDQFDLDSLTDILQEFEGPLQ